MSDYIKRTDVMKICEEYSEHCFDVSNSRGQDIADSILDDVIEIPTADVEEVKHGEWIRGGVWGDTGSVAYKCSVCRETTYDGNYFERCPHCGAKMDRERK